MAHLLEPLEIAHLVLDRPLLAAAPPGHEDSEQQKPDRQRQAEHPAPRPAENGTRFVEQRLTPFVVEFAQIQAEWIGQNAVTCSRYREVGEVASTSITELRIPQEGIHHPADGPRERLPRFCQPGILANENVMNDFDRPIHPVAVPALDVIAERFGKRTTRDLIFGYVEQAVAAGIRSLADQP